jgi:hypothetical protein
VAEEMHKLKLKGWYASSAGARAEGDTTSPGPAILLIGRSLTT